MHLTLGRTTKVTPRTSTVVQGARGWGHDGPPFGFSLCYVTVFQTT